MSSLGKVGNRCRRSWKVKEMRKPVFYDRASGFFDNTDAGGKSSPFFIPPRFILISKG